MKVINRTVVVLSLVSLLADVASEMLYPVIPVYLKEIGFSVLLIGVLEGVANFTAGLSKGYFGKASDESGRRLPFVKLGYFLSAVAKPALALSANVWWVFAVRTTDRLGKGIRTASRDALLSQNATPQTKARVFGFHRSMDTLGAAIGPAVALLLIYLFPGNYTLLFLLAGIPGLLSVAAVFGLKEQAQPSSTLGKGTFFSFFNYWKIASPDYKKLVVGSLLLALFNSSDIFLLLKVKEVTGSDQQAIISYILYNAVFAAASYPLGALADRIGIRTVFLCGLLLFAAVYGLFAVGTTTVVFFAAFFAYGLYAAATEGITKAWITNLAHGSNTATAVGFYTSAQSVCTLVASIITGWVWTAYGSTAALLVTTIAAVGVLGYFLIAFRQAE